MRVFYLLTVAVLLAGNVFAQNTNVNGIAIIVDESIITRQEVFESIGPAVRLVLDSVRDPEARERRLSKLYEDGTEYLVNRQLILHEYKTAGYNYPESVIEDRIQDRIKQRYHDRAELMQSLHAQRSTYESFRQQQREDILIGAMRQLKISSDVLISPQKIRDYYEQHPTNFAVGDSVKLRMIVLNKPPSDKGEVQQLAADILRKINEGAAFAEMARIHSDGPYKAAGGERGWVERDSDRKELSDVAFALKPGERSGVIDLPDSCWLIQVEECKPAHARPLAEVREQIERELRIEESERQEQKWIKRLREKSFLRYY